MDTIPVGLNSHYQLDFLLTLVLISKKWQDMFGRKQWSGAGQQNSHDGNDDCRGSGNHRNQPAGVGSISLGNVLTKFGKFGIPLGIVFPHACSCLTQFGFQELPSTIIALGYCIMRTSTPQTYGTVLPIYLLPAWYWKYTAIPKKARVFTRILLYQGRGGGVFSIALNFAI